MFKRDGYNKSLWQKTAGDYSASNIPVKGKIYDIVIVGGGITGVCTGIRLQSAGLSCLLIEAENLCFGTTGGTTAHINTLLDNPYSVIASKFGSENARLVAQAAKDAVRLIELNVRTYKIDCEFEKVNAYLFSQDKKQTRQLHDIVTATNEAGVKMTYVNKIPVPDFMQEAALVPGQAKFHPVKYVHGLAQAFEKAGGVIVQQCRATGLQEGEHLTIETSSGDFLSRNILYATHTPPGVNLMHMRCQPYRSYAMAVRLDRQAYPEDLSYDMVDPYHYYRTQVIDGKPYLVVGGFDHKTGKDTNTEKCFEELEQFIRERFAVSSISAKWSSQYFEPADSIPYIGQLPGHGPNVFVAGGFGGNGMTYSHVTALVIHALLDKRKKKAYDHLFSPSRISPIAGFTNFISQGLDTAVQLTRRLLPAKKENNRRPPACTHMGCQLHFNDTERSWDCSCHGSRFDTKGKVLTAPATKPLPPG